MNPRYRHCELCHTDQTKIVLGVPVWFKVRRGGRTLSVCRECWKKEKAEERRNREFVRTAKGPMRWASLRRFLIITGVVTIAIVILQNIFN